MSFEFVSYFGLRVSSLATADFSNWFGPRARLEFLTIEYGRIGATKQQLQLLNKANEDGVGNQ